MISLAQTLRHLFPDGVELHDWIVSDGVITVWNRPESQPTPAELAAAELPAAKAATIAANRAECSRRIYARYPAGRQSSVALGVYSGAEAEAQAQIMKDWISDMVAAENAAADAIEAVQPGPNAVAAVEAVTVAWPA